MKNNKGVWSGFAAVVFSIGGGLTMPALSNTGVPRFQARPVPAVHAASDGNLSGPPTDLAVLPQAPPPVAAPSPWASACTCVREMEFDTTINRCGVRYRQQYDDGPFTGPRYYDWSFTAPGDDNSSCQYKQVRVRECVEWRGPGC